ncbi:type VI secretion system protein TssA [Roseibium denhamense]|uniref:Type VI secretion system protein VasJ n=1 Tax=Roseibium denhamense TaxID=76305 RepID=A0ABY1NWP4_9HYPH|nr:type VI secretion system protein TssA [Roseibium denhamense]MTI04871.1 type VI secretion system protein TssA [Roseibium denhamense]SMP20276.1 type VI secretion system protein VasJ [Roseibium denhamense]
MAEDLQIPELTDPRAEAGRHAIADGDGQEAFRDTPEFEELEAEFRKMEIDGPSAVNWKMLNDETVKVIQEKSKDLVLATRLVYGLFLEEGYQGLAIGIKILEDMSKEHWETLVPPVRRERGRAGAFDWCAEKLGPLVEAKKPEGAEGLAALQAHDYLLELDTALEQKFTKSSAALGPLIRALRPLAKDARAALEEEARKKAEAEAAASAPDAAPAQSEPEPSANAPASSAPAPEPAQAAPAPTPTPAAPAAPVDIPEVATDGDLNSGFLSLFNAASKLATTARQNAPADPRGYYCARFALWGRVLAAPPANSGKTSLPAPQKNRIAELQALKGAGNMEGLAKAAESAFISSPFWLDTQHMVAEALKGLGDDYAAAAALVEGELSGFIRRVPEVLDLAFSDGTPFASAETKAWISENLSGSGGGGGGGSDALLGIASEAAGLAQSGKIVEGLRVLKTYCDTCPSEREWFRAQLKLAELCLRFDVLHPLVAQLSKLRSIAETRQLSSWEPELVVELARLSWQSLNHKNIRQLVSDADLVPLKASVMETLSILDLTAAAELTGKR